MGGDQIFDEILGYNQGICRSYDHKMTEKSMSAHIVHKGVLARATNIDSIYGSHPPQKGTPTNLVRAQKDFFLKVRGNKR